MQARCKAFSLVPASCRSFAKCAGLVLLAALKLPRLLSPEHFTGFVAPCAEERHVKSLWLSGAALASLPRLMCWQLCFTIKGTCPEWPPPWVSAPLAPAAGSLRTGHLYIQLRGMMRSCHVGPEHQRRIEDEERSPGPCRKPSRPESELLLLLFTLAGH